MFSKIKSILNNDNVFSFSSISSLASKKKKYTKNDFLTAYEINLYLNRALNKRADKVGEVEFIVKKGDKVVDDHDFKFLTKPSNLLNKNQFFSLWQKQLDIFGEAYAVMDNETTLKGSKNVDELTILPSCFVKPKFDKSTGQLASIEYSVTNKTYQAVDIIHQVNPAVSNPTRGESLIASGMRQAEILTSIDEYQSTVLENGGKIDGVFRFKNALNAHQLAEIKDKYQELYGEAKKAGLPMFLSGDASYERVSLTPEELAYLGTKKMTIQDIVALTGVPKTILGLTSDESFANGEMAIRVFHKETINPLLESIVSTFSTLIDEGYTLEFKDKTPEDKEENRKDIENGVQNHYLTVNEAREMAGKEPIDNGDVIYQPFNLIAQGEQVMGNKETKTKGGIKHPLKDIETRRAYHSLCVKRLDNRQNIFLQTLIHYFTGQEARIIEKLKATKSFKTKGLVEEIFNEKLEVAISVQNLLPVLSELLKNSAEDAKEIAGSHWEFNETSEISSWLDKKVRIFSEQINATTFKKLKKEFAESFNENENRSQLIERVQETYGNISETRAVTIARTEVHGVTQYGTMQGYQQAQMPIKIWVWAPGLKGGTRDNHIAMDGEERPTEQPFSNGLMFPGDSGDAGEVINCECFI